MSAMKHLALCILALTFTIGCGDDDEPMDASEDGAFQDTTPDGNAVDATSEDATLDAIVDSASDAANGDIEVRGTWDTSLSTVEQITNTAWASAAVVKYDNDANFAVTQNPVDPGSASSEKFNKIEWTEIGGEVFHYCTVDFDLDTLAEAEGTTQTADKGDLPSGCGGFAWTMMTRQ